MTRLIHFDAHLSLSSSCYYQYTVEQQLGHCHAEQFHPWTSPTKKHEAGRSIK